MAAAGIARAQPRYIVQKRRSSPPPSPPSLCVQAAPSGAASFFPRSAMDSIPGLYRRGRDRRDRRQDATARTGARRALPPAVADRRRHPRRDAREPCARGLRRARGCAARSTPDDPAVDRRRGVLRRRRVGARAGQARRRREARQPALGVFRVTMVAFFLAEMGDKTQIATVVLAARYDSLVPVVAGTTLGMLLADVPAVLLGNAARGAMAFRAAGWCSSDVRRARRWRAAALSGLLCGAVGRDEGAHLGGVQVRHRPERHAAVSSSAGVVATPGDTTHRSRVAAVAQRPDEEIDHVLAVPIDERRHRALIQIVEAPAHQREAGSGGPRTGSEKSSRPLSQGLTECWSELATSARWPVTTERA